MYLEDSTFSRSGAAMMALNDASDKGGALYARGSSVSWLAETNYLDNFAGDSDGALCAICLLYTSPSPRD